MLGDIVKAAIIASALPATALAGTVSVIGPAPRLNLAELVLSKRPQLAELSRYLRDQGLLLLPGEVHRTHFEGLLEEDRERPGYEGTYIVGGDEQPSPASPVGLLRLDGSPHCTATLVGSRTLVTAAHCVASQDAKDLFDAARLDFTLDPKPDGSSLGMQVDSVLPHPDYELTVVPFSLSNDIALVYLKVATTRSHGELSTTALAAGSTHKYRFEGYGYSYVDPATGSGSGQGVRRDVTLDATAAEKTMSFGTPTQGTCDGDSGGPGMTVDSSLGTPLVTTVVSFTNNYLCSTGSSGARVDVYRSWWSGKVK